MAKICELCSKGGLTGNWVSHSHRKTKRRQYPNLQRRTIGGRRLWVCTNCLKNLRRKNRNSKVKKPRKGSK